MSDLFSLLSFGPDGWGDQLAQGAAITLGLAVATVPFGLVLGLLVALARDSKSRILRGIGHTFSTVFRGLPELLTLFIVYYGGQIALQKLVALFTDAYVEVPAFVAGMLALGMVFAAYASEVFMGAFRSVSKGQGEAGWSLGLSNHQTFRLVIFPQVWRYALPGIANLWLVLLKDTSLVSVIALNDLLRMTDVAARSTKEPFFFFLTACLLYLVMSLISGIGISAIERRAHKAEGRSA